MSKAPSKKKVAWRGEHPERQTNYRERNEPEARWLVEGVCKLIQSAANQNFAQLNLIVDDDEVLRYMDATRTTVSDHDRAFISLEDFLASRTSCSLGWMKRAGRLVLMVIVANAFLHFHDGPWAKQNWSKRNIYLSTTESG